MMYGEGEEEVGLRRYTSRGESGW